MSSNFEPIQIVSDGKQMFIINDGMCYEIGNPLIERVNYAIDRTSGFQNIEVDISVLGSGFNITEGHNIIFNNSDQKQKDIIKDYTIFELLQLINEKIKERK